MNRGNVFAIHRCINEGYGLIRIFTEKIRISPTKLWRVCISLIISFVVLSMQIPYILADLTIVDSSKISKHVRKLVL